VVSQGEMGPDGWGQGPRGESFTLLVTKKCGIHFLKHSKR